MMTRRGFLRALGGAVAAAATGGLQAVGELWADRTLCELPRGVVWGVWGFGDWPPRARPFSEMFELLPNSPPLLNLMQSGALKVERGADGEPTFSWFPTG